MCFRETLHLNSEALSLDMASPSRVTVPTTWGWVGHLAGGSSGSALLDLDRLFFPAGLLDDWLIFCFWFFLCLGLLLRLRLVLCLWLDSDNRSLKRLPGWL